MCGFVFTCGGYRGLNQASMKKLFVHRDDKYGNGLLGLLVGVIVEL